ncbi:unnamed protein product [Fusarium graminearum]|uniref:Chromosome 2, complete genome n=1 Tax=Gibberella zeae (strain ATCC MYA-4620 / CBS 123657 / FGSC 9075 / NRRL 31084 / PH-1) TaxID=229533 RepID=A0A098DEY0_GIBZE|nr:unnamed protein product [Fusarium graminearum]CZS80282.1 unnamed protein product [Fusarium graminearum]
MLTGQLYCPQIDWSIYDDWNKSFYREYACRSLMLDPTQQLTKRCDCLLMPGLSPGMSRNNTGELSFFHVFTLRPSSVWVLYPSEDEVLSKIITRRGSVISRIVFINDSGELGAKLLHPDLETVDLVHMYLAGKQGHVVEKVIWSCNL